MNLMWCVWIYLVFSVRPAWERWTEGLPVTLELAFLLLIPWWTKSIRSAAVWGLITGLSADALAGNDLGPRMIAWGALCAAWAGVHGDRLRLGQLVRSGLYLLCCGIAMTGVLLAEQHSGLQAGDWRSAWSEGLLGGAVSGLLGMAILHGPGQLISRVGRANARSSVTAGLSARRGRSVQLLARR